ncbi:hypothetical protein Gpo141_00013429 [Globisporangium polare]
MRMAADAPTDSEATPLLGATTAPASATRTAIASRNDPDGINVHEFADTWVHPESQASFLSKVTFRLTGDCLSFIGPVCIHELIKYVEDPSSAWFAPRYYGYILSCVLFASTLLQILFLHQHHHLVIREGIRVRAALTVLVYNKSLRLSSQSKSQLGTGRILNMATIDTNRILDFVNFGPFGVSVSSHV